MKKISLCRAPLSACAALVALAATSCKAQAPAPIFAVPLGTTQAALQPAANVTDEPIGARASLGLSLWHMGHDANYIQKFHQFLRAQNQMPNNLLAPAVLNPPQSLQRILVEPEHLAPQMLNGWKTQGDYIVGTHFDNGPDASVPIRVERGGTFRLWVGYYNWPTGTALTTLKLYRAGAENEAPLLSDEIYDAPQPQEGLAWHDVMVDLPAGNYVAKLGYARAWWHITGGQLNKNAPAPQRNLRARQIDCLYLTDELWAGPPSALTRNGLRGGPGIGGQWTAQVPVTNIETWRWWQVRPASWDERGQTQLFNLSRAFWRSQIDALARQDYGANPPDYRAPVRQIIFDDVWNMIGNPVIIQRRVNELSRGVRTGNSVSSPVSTGTSYGVRGGDFTQLGEGWEKDGNSLKGGYGNITGTASANVRVDKPGVYTAWVRFKLLPNFYANWRLSVQGPSGGVSWDHTADNYNNEWQRAGQINVNRAGDVRVQISPLPAQKPNTYRIIHQVLLTSQDNFVPTGDVQPTVARNSVSGAPAACCQRWQRAASVVQYRPVCRAADAGNNGRAKRRQRERCFARARPNFGVSGPAQHNGCAGYIRCFVVAFGRARRCSQWCQLARSGFCAVCGKRQHAKCDFVVAVRAFASARHHGSAARRGRFVDYARQPKRARRKL